MRELHLFAGAGGGILGGILLGHTCVCAVEIEPYCRKILLQRQRDDILPKFPIWDDVRTFDGKPWRGLVDVVCGGFPCQDVSTAGSGRGIKGEKSGLWREMARIIREVRPEFVFVENSPALTYRGLGDILGELAELGYNARWGVLGDKQYGKVHRERIWILAVTYKIGWFKIGKVFEEVDNHKHTTWAPSASICIDEPIRLRVARPPEDFGVVDDMANKMDIMQELGSIGNGQIPRVAALAWKVLNGEVANA